MSFNRKILQTTPATPCNRFNKEDPYQGTLGVYSKKYYMKDVT